MLLADQQMTTSSLGRVSWAPPADSGGVHHYQLQRRRGTGAWTDVSLAGPLATTANVALTIGASYAFRIRALDAVGNGGPWSSGAAATLRRLEETATSVTYQSGFKRRVLAGASADHVRKGAIANRTATLAFTGTTVAFVSTLAPARGIVRIRVDGGDWQDVDLYGPQMQKKRVVWAAALSPGSHTLQVAVSGTRNAASSANRIDVDAFLIR